MSIETTNGFNATPLYTKGSAHTSLPTDSYGTVSVNEYSHLLTAAEKTYSFPNGLAGITLTNVVVDYTNSLRVPVYVAFNNTAFNDTAVPGLRHVLGSGDSMSIAFTSEPLPTQVKLLSVNETADGDSVTAFSAAEA